MGDTNDGREVAAAGEVVDLRSRQQRRAEAREARKTWEDVYTDSDPRLQPLMKARHMLFAMLRQAGRIRIPAAELQAVDLRDKVDVKVADNGDLIVEYLGER